MGMAGIESLTRLVRENKTSFALGAGGVITAVASALTHPALDSNSVYQEDHRLTVAASQTDSPMQAKALREEQIALRSTNAYMDDKNQAERSSAGIVLTGVFFIGTGLSMERKRKIDAANRTTSSTSGSFRLVR